MLAYPSLSLSDEANYSSYPVVSCFVERLPHKSPFAIVFRVCHMTLSVGHMTICTSHTTLAVCCNTTIARASLNDDDFCL